MRFMVIALKSGEVLGAVTRNRKQAYDWLKVVTKNVHADNIAAWRYWHAGWADSSDENAWQHITSLPSHVAVEIYR